MPINIKLNMPVDSKHDKNQKITDFTTKLQTPTANDIDQASNPCKRSINNLSPLSLGKGPKKLIMENTMDTQSSSTETSNTQGLLNTTTERETNSSLQTALGPLIIEVRLLRESVNTVHVDYTDLKRMILKQKNEVKHELAQKIESNT